MDAILWFFQELAMGFYNIGYALTHPALWLDWSDKQALMRFVYYGASTELFFAVLDIFLVVTIVGFLRPQFMWGCVRVLEGIGNTVGRFAAWAGLLMVLQQVIIVFIQRIFAQATIAVGFGTAVEFDISWWAEELKLYNAIVVALCCAYTFVQGGHVRVDLVYAAVRFRTKKVIDMFGSMVFVIPAAILTYMYAWFFLWRHLIVPKPSASDTIERLLAKSRALRWNVETIGFSPNGFNGYFLFKILLVLFCVMVMLQGIAFFYRSWLEYREGEGSANKYLDKDELGDEDAELVAEIH